MDTKRLVTQLLIVGMLVIGYNLVLNHFYKEHPDWRPGSQQTPTVTSTDGTPNAGGQSSGTTQPAIIPGGWATTQPVVAMPASIGTDETKYQMTLAVDPLGAGLGGVKLAGFYTTAAHEAPYVFESPLMGVETDTRALATRSVTINGQLIDLSTTNWQQTSVSQDSTVYTTTVFQNGKPALLISKTFSLRPKTGDGEGYEMLFGQSFRNLTGQPIKVSETFNGPTPPPGENDRSEDRRYVSGRDEGDKTISVASTAITDAKKDKPPVELVTASSYPMVWVGACSSYFQAILLPSYAGQTTSPDVKIASALVTGLDPAALAKPLQDSEKNLYPTSLQITTSEFTIAPSGETPFNASIFFGPKKRSLLEEPYYHNFPRAFDQNLVYTSGICGYITFTWLINLLYGILAFFHYIFLKDWGLAIIGLVCLVRLILHPITKKSQISMMQMSKKGPEIERLKKKYADDKEALNKAMMEVMNPGEQLLGCLPMFLQTPIWIALWNALQSTFELRQSGFLRWGGLHLTWISDLSHPDALIQFSQPIPLFIMGWHLHSINVLPILVGAVAYFQQAMMPQPTNMTPEQEQQRKMQKFMFLLFPLMLYVGPAGLNLYILTSSTIGMIESKIIRDHIKQQEEAEKTGQIIVDAPRKGGGGGKRKKDDPKKAAPPKGRFAAWLADLQAKAEEVRREQEKRNKKRA
jgi:YidC/Oxa1 family membrane protein insertase